MKYLPTKSNAFAWAPILLIIFQLFAFDNALATTYTFTGIGDWNVASNWQGNAVPPSTLLNGDNIIINYTDICNLTTDLTLEFGSSIICNSNNWNIGSHTIINNGTITITRDVNSDNFNFINNVSGLIITSGSIFVHGTLTNAGNIQGNDGQWILSGNDNANSGTISLTNNCHFNIEPSGLLDNSGLFELNDNSMVRNSGTFTNNSTIQINSTFQNGEMWGPPAPATLINNGTIKGTGTLQQAGTFTNNSAGSIAPGASPGKLSVSGNFNLGSGTYSCEINGTGQGTTYDWLDISGTATIDGSSKLNIVFGYTPAVGTTFDIFTASSVSGAFSYPANVAFSGGGVGNIAVSYPDGNKVRVEVMGLLPVELVRFEVKAKSTAAQLKWETASEQDNLGFEIQRSTNGSNWEKLGFVPGNGTTSTANHYVFTDEKPLAGINYYRLRQMDFDNKANYSPIQTVVFARTAGLIGLSPNPASATTEITFDIDFDGAASLSIFDSAGRSILAQTFAVNTGKTQLPLDLSGLPMGTYWVEIKANNQLWRERLVVN